MQFFSSVQISIESISKLPLIICSKTVNLFAVGPSIKDIVKVYDQYDASLVEFLKGNKEAIVETDPGQVAIMKANLDGFVKDLKDEELQALAASMKNAQ